MILSFWHSYSLSAQNLLSFLISYGDEPESKSTSGATLLSGPGFFFLCPPGAAVFSRERVGCLVATRPSPGNHVYTHTLGQARVWSTWRRKAPVRPLYPTCLPHLCRSQDRRRPRPRPRLRSQSSPWSQRRALSAHCLARPAARTCCPSQCFMGRWTLKTHSWPPVRRRSRSC